MINSWVAIRLIKDSSSHYIITLHKGDENGPVLLKLDVGTELAYAVAIIDEIRLHLREQYAKFLNYFGYYSN